MLIPQHHLVVYSNRIHGFFQVPGQEHCNGPAIKHKSHISNWLRQNPPIGKHIVKSVTFRNNNVVIRIRTFTGRGPH